ncbi:hypothetical protein [Thalassotalea sediminis]|uniref:hypothetical protein n=1 Tax=Thalassotalea sediminis TaxID=1759089 RepID=UPI0025747653|nr:hypothetical protein [Thalassotalea sediminis]
MYKIDKGRELASYFVKIVAFVVSAIVGYLFFPILLIKATEHKLVTVIYCFIVFTPFLLLYQNQYRAIKLLGWYLLLFWCFVTVLFKALVGEL